MRADSRRQQDSRDEAASSRQRRSDAPANRQWCDEKVPLSKCPTSSMQWRNDRWCIHSPSRKYAEVYSQPNADVYIGL